MAKLSNLARIAALLFVIAAGTPVLRPTDHNSAVVGKVIDQTGGPITGALIEVVSGQVEADSRATVTTRADKRGNFKIENISLTVYTLRISARGFKPSNDPH
jgi:Carboxypeptidase regulatory-like domain